MFLFLVTFLGMITLLLILKDLLRGWMLLGSFRTSSRHPSWLLIVGVLFVSEWSMIHTFGVVPLIQPSRSLMPFSLINNFFALTTSLQFLYTSRIVASLSILLYCNRHCSSELSRRIPPALSRVRVTTLSKQSIDSKNQF
ncbi:UNVERIFIED_CONTAM: hypothetical protein RMT77_019950 [Armadillidium vulgare]